MVAITTTVKRIAEMDGRVRIVQGGARAGKTMAIMLLLIDYALRNPDTTISTFSLSLPHLRRGAIKDFTDIMKAIGLYQDRRHNKSIHTYIFDNGSTFEFISADQPEKLRGSKRDISFINEANLITVEHYAQIVQRTSLFTILDFNPTRRFWAHDELANRTDASFLKVTYLHNEALPKGIRSEFDVIREKAKTSNYWRNYWRVYGEGEIGNSIESVYPDFKVWFGDIPKEARPVAIGMDFGFTNDPTAIVAIYYIDGKYIVDELAYGYKMKVSGMIERLRNFDCQIYADNAEPRTISELNDSLGYGTVVGVKGSITETIELVKQIPIWITERSSNILNEQQNYLYLRDKNGNLTNKPIDEYNHALDALRYAVIGLKSNKYKGEYYVR